uniref:uncharacterized protein LOC124070623 n=1 Tax=Scatophagus argus TaxID=75038 RepID=UPI001ED8069F|nr:uncharacterized protein LOC124070623 [Scatophagus argus]
MSACEKTTTAGSQCCKMMLLCRSILFLCLSANAENILFRGSGENVTLECSYAGCPSSIEGYPGMYLYKDLVKLEEVYYWSERIILREGYNGRIEEKGLLKNHSIIISNLTVDDTGLYKCVYTKLRSKDITCNVYILAVTVNDRVNCAPAYENKTEENPQLHKTTQPHQSPPLVLVIIVTGIICTLVTAIFTLLILPKVRKWTSGRKTRVSAVPSDFIYEVMTKVKPQAAPEDSTPSANGFA